MYAYKLKSNYSFNTYAPSILGTSVRNAKLVAILDYEVAAHYTTPNTSHVSVYPYLPAGTPNNPEKYTYLLFQTEGGERFVYANVWIDENTIKESTNNVLTIVIENAASGDETDLRNLLSLKGYKFQMSLG